MAEEKGKQTSREYCSQEDAIKIAGILRANGYTDEETDQILKYAKKIAFGEFTYRLESTASTAESTSERRS